MIKLGLVENKTKDWGFTFEVFNYIWFFSFLVYMCNKCFIQKRYSIDETQISLLYSIIGYLCILFIYTILKLVIKAEKDKEFRLLKYFQIIGIFLYYSYIFCILLGFVILLGQYLFRCSENLNIFEILSILLFIKEPLSHVTQIYKDPILIQFSKINLFGVMLNCIFLFSIFLQNNVNFLNYDRQESIFFCLFFTSCFGFIGNFIFFRKDIKSLIQETVVVKKTKVKLILIHSFINYFLVFSLGLGRFYYYISRTPLVGYFFNDHLYIGIEAFINFFLMLLVSNIIIIFLIMFTNISKNQEMFLSIIYFIFGILGLLLIRPLLADFVYITMPNEGNFFYKYFWLNLVYIFKNNDE